MKKQKKKDAHEQSTRQLMGIVRVTPHGIVTDSGERVFFLIQPDNLSVLSPERKQPGSCVWCWRRLRCWR